MSQPRTRREALMIVGLTLGYVHGTPVSASQGSSGRGLTLVLDEVDAIILSYRGQKVVVQPRELMAALAPEPLMQMKR